MRARAKWAGLGCTREKDSHPSMFLAQYLCLHHRPARKFRRRGEAGAPLLSGSEEESEGEGEWRRTNRTEGEVTKSR
jgi:hypothetical protein